MPRAGTRAQPCDRRDALNRLMQAEAFVTAAAMVLEDTTDVARPGVAAALAVLAGVAASDAACCARLRRRARGQAHDEASALLATVEPHGPEMAKDLDRLLSRKDSSQYGMAFVSSAEATRMVSWARRLLDRAATVIEA
jgi:tagatose-1,6-bisphosphate aldolase